MNFLKIFKIIFKDNLLKKNRGYFLNSLNIKPSELPRYDNLYKLEYRQRDAPIDALERCHGRQRYTPKGGYR